MFVLGALAVVRLPAAATMVTTRPVVVVASSLAPHVSQHQGLVPHSPTTSYITDLNSLKSKMTAVEPYVEYTQ